LRLQPGGAFGQAAQDEVRARFVAAMEALV